MNVVNGIWCGCAVWVDLNNNSSFEDAENLHYEYVGGDPSYIYDFTIPIPANTPTGSYRLRVIAAWGSDGFLNTNTNGYGPCGDFQYGNFDDFTLNVMGSTGIAQAGDPTGVAVTVGPNPTDGLVTLTTQGDVDRIKVLTTDGRAVQDHGLTTRAEKVQVDLSALPNGVYLLQCISGTGSRTLQVMKQ
ncbi:MAG: T9SS type A sorting domain-containing protein [Flavobacteriales bacterium]